MEMLLMCAISFETVVIYRILNSWPKTGSHAK